MTEFFIILVSLIVIFYIVTYPYPFKLVRKVCRVLSFKEITYIENKDFNYADISPEELSDKLIIEKRVIDSKKYINEDLE